ncbi:MAG TPA: ATP-binding protein, partial [Candidatus Nitrosotenuis sp.]|nr:ATP-binding protein [Candidatus Nitrosotenuis sp.]
KSERFSTLGEMSARLAHDIRNPLSVIKVNIQLLQNHLQGSNDEEFQKRMDAINRSMQRIEHQIDDVLGYVRTTPLTLTNVSVLKMLSDAVKTTPIQENIRVVLPKNDLKITCDEKKLIVVFSNLILNSVQAMEGNGTVTINLRNERQRALVEIVDTGPGVPEDDLIKIFEPLFTTKQVGTGLGLVTCRNIVEQHHGTISVKNNPTTFTIDLPITQ